MSTTIGRDHVVNLVTGNRHPFAVHFDFVVVANHATLGRATIHQVAARTLAVISFEIRVEALMPFIVACPVISFLRRCAYTMKRGERTTEHDPSSSREQLPAHDRHLGCAAGEVSGIVALLLERNRKLTPGASHRPEPKLWSRSPVPSRFALEVRMPRMSAGELASRPARAGSMSAPEG
jgi:hypothetical protein